MIFWCQLPPVAKPRPVTYTVPMPDVSSIPSKFRAPAIVQPVRHCTMIARMANRWALGWVSDDDFIQYVAAVGESLLDFSTNMNVARQYWINQRAEVEAGVTPEAVEAMASEVAEFLGQYAQPPEVAEGDDPHTDPAPDQTE